MKSITKKIIATVAMIILSIIANYFLLPAWNIHSYSCWAFVIIIFTTAALIFAAIDSFDSTDNSKITASMLISSAVSIVVLLTLFLFSAPIFNASAYANVMKVDESPFTEAIPATDMDRIITVDRDTAAKYGSRKIGTLSEYVSQYEVSNKYTQINEDGIAYSVSPLEFSSIFKWANMHTIPGYVKVNTYTGDVKFIECQMKVSPSGYFSEDLERICRFKYPSVMFGNFNFEIDDDGVPYYVAPIYKYTIGVFGGKDIDGAIMVNAVTGEVIKYDLDSVPEWVDHVFNGELVINQLNWHYAYQNGFWNTVFGQKNVRQTTTGYGYINGSAEQNDVYLYTGITSVGTDESNLGFVLVNMRTGATTYSECPSAEEYSAMDTSKGAVQEKGYEASFPVLININDKPVYFLTLKDSAGLVKAYSLVDAQDYTKVKVADTLEDVWKEFTSYVSTTTNEEAETIEAMVNKIIPVVIDGNTVYYITFEDNDMIFVADIHISNKLPFIEAGETISVNAIGTTIVSIE